MILLTHVTEDDERRWPTQMARTRDSFVHGRRNMVVEKRGTVEHTSTGTLCKFAHEVRVVPRGPPHRPRRRRLSGGIRERSCNTVVGRRYGLPTGAYRYTQALCRTEVEYGLYWRHLLHG
ncbi:LOW QUALITY PROTEIN: uncharacterized protein LOC114872326 [Osmia bicornis bicornis]|uniref:LOW QUALITY PROTEIN: uncharacterized protein LOC114872326 n=1 Tax=Osmia bicornis bicornis TaxID=1437191 RepID=UPI001EAEE0E6|nr:LOW QUALITY PROTEIN: uncharacterized protein LOC114872326 [Osmia bicornis bicornis]